MDRIIRRCARCLCPLAAVLLGLGGGCSQRTVDACANGQSGDAACISLQVEPPPIPGVPDLSGRRDLGGQDLGATDLNEVDTIFVNLRAQWGQAGGPVTIRPGGRFLLPASIGVALRPGYLGDVVLEVSVSRDDQLLGCAQTRPLKITEPKGQRLDAGSLVLRTDGCFDRDLGI